MPKTGGTSIEGALRAGGWTQHFYTDTSIPEVEVLHRAMLSSQQHLHGELLQSVLDLDLIDLAFTVVRHPVARFRSEYCYRNAAELQAGLAQSLEDWAETVFAEHGRNPYHLDNHLRPQVEFLVPGVEVFRFEDGIDHVLAELDERHDLGIPPIAEIPAYARYALDSRTQARISSSEVPISAALQDRLEDLYRADFEVFGYGAELPGEPPRIDLPEGGTGATSAGGPATTTEPLPNGAEPASADDSEGRARVVAFNLPQFHAIAENDAWWGEGFTEWTGVRAARPQFRGHVQPNVPGPLGYYDLTDVAIQHAQQELAKTFGVDAFCHYVYWFGGKRLLERPLEVIRDNADLTLPYFFCWANEPWTRRWDGAERDVLQAQTHDRVGDARLIDDLAEHLTDSRYLRVHGRPVLLVYRTSLLDDPVRTTDALRERAAQLGIGELYLAAVQSFGFRDPRGHGFDAAVEFPPHNLEMGKAAARFEAPPPSSWRGNAMDYEATIEWVMSAPVPDYRLFRGVMPAWDNTPRRGGSANIWTGDSPELFQQWMERALHYTYLFNPPGERLVFVNAWNEWGEGAYLEPDERRGFARLEALQRAVAHTDGLAKSTAGAHDADPLVQAARTYFRAAAGVTREILALEAAKA